MIKLCILIDLRCLFWTPHLDRERAGPNCVAAARHSAVRQRGEDRLQHGRRGAALDERENGGKRCGRKLLHMRLRGEDSD